MTPFSGNQINFNFFSRVQNIFIDSCNKSLSIDSTLAEEDEVDSSPVPPPVVTQSLSQTYASTVQEDSIPDINDVLKKLNLSDYSSKFDEEKIDTETLVSY